MRDAVIVEAVKQPGSNTVQVADAVKKALGPVSQTIGNGFKTTLLVDQSDLIRANAEEVYVALFFGGAMAVLIILLFLLDPRGTFISSLALPTSVIGSHGLPGWVWLAREALQAGRLGATDVRELMEDATQVPAPSNPATADRMPIGSKRCCSR